MIPADKLVILLAAVVLLVIYANKNNVPVSNYMAVAPPQELDNDADADTEQVPTSHRVAQAHEGQGQDDFYYQQQQQDMYDDHGLM